MRADGYTVGFLFFSSETAHPNSSCDGNLHPNFTSTLRDNSVVRSSLCVSGDIVTWLTPYSEKQCCKVCSICAHSSSVVPGGTQTCREARMTLEDPGHVNN